VLIEKIGNSSLIFTIRLMHGDNTTLCAEGKLIWVCVNPADNKPCPIPDEARQALTRHFPFVGA